jgi:hypothetical protein
MAPAAPISTDTGTIRVAATALVGMGMWSWLLPTQPSNRVPPNTGRSLAQMPERDVGTAVYGEGHSRPAQPHSGPSTAAGDALDPAAKKAAMVVYAETTVCKATLVLLEWVRGVARLNFARAPRDVPLHRWQQHRRWSARGPLGRPTRAGNLPRMPSPASSYSSGRPRKSAGNHSLR